MPKVKIGHITPNGILNFK